jgi:hypothetical protein
VALGSNGQLADVGCVGPRHHETELHVGILARLEHRVAPGA